ncbi:hypothetical protein OROGR_024747 [Orobanche gracilis]
MGTEVEHTSGDVQMNVTTPSSTTSTSGPKISMFAKKSGFVIPKNKLSGSLVPICRGTKKGDADLIDEEVNNQVSRKTRWGPDLSLHTTVRRGRALAYETRIGQISQQLTLGTLELEGDDDSLSTSDYQLSKEESELMELERREIIGELLQLNPNFKAPADYKPPLKEAKVPIPIKEYPGYNFIGLVFGPTNVTQKRLEKETGAKIQVYGTKSDMRVKVEIIPSDGKEINGAYEDLYVHVSADSFEKVDAAVALIELLLTPVSVPVSSSTILTSVSDNIMNTYQNKPGSIISPSPTNQSTPPPPFPRPLPPPQGQLPQYPQPWFPPNPTHTSTLLSNTVQVSSSPFNPTTTMSSLFGHRPNIAMGFSPVLQNSSVSPNRPQNTMQSPYVQQAFPLGQTGGPRNAPGSSTAGPPYNVMPVLPLSTPPIVSSHGYNAIASQNTVVSRAPSANVPDMIGPPFGPALSESSRQTIQPSSLGPARPAMPQAMRVPIPFPQSSSPNSIFGGPPSFGSANPIPVSFSRPQQPSFSDFTFQPHNNPRNVNPKVWPNNQPTYQNVRPPLRAGPPSLAPQPPMLRSAMGNSNPLAVQSFSRLQINQPGTQTPTNFAGNMTGPIPSRHLIMPTGPRMHPWNTVPTQHINNSSGAFSTRPGHRMQIPENHLRSQQRFLSPHQDFGDYPRRPFSIPSSGPQVYDPFSPTSAPFNSQMGGTDRVHGESDPEYEDLMASVGVQ